MKQLILVAGLMAVCAPALAENAHAKFDHRCCAATDDNFTGITAAYNSTGQGVSAQYLATGQYMVTLQGITGEGHGGHVQVTATGSLVGGYQGTYCKAVSWGTSWGNTQVRVHCFNRSGAPSNSGAVVMYTSDPSPSPSFAYVWAHSPSTSIYTPNPSYSVNGSGQIEIRRTGTGRYDVRLYGQSQSGGTVAVSAYGWSNHRCHVERWSGGSPYKTVKVRCNSPAGSPRDSTFSLLYTKGGMPMGNPTGASANAYLWAGNATASSYTPLASYQWSTGYGITHSSRITIGRWATGHYGVNVPGDPAWGQITIITPYGAEADSLYCEARGAGVDCWNSAGALANARFTYLQLGH